MNRKEVSFEAPYPLQGRFRKIVLPALLFLIIVIGFLMSNGSMWLIQKIYLEISENRAGIIDRALRGEDRAAWNDLQMSDDPWEVFKDDRGRHLLESLRGEVQELGLSHLKIYGQGGLLLYSSEEDQIGKFDPSAGYLSALRGQRNLIEKQAADGTKLYELYVRAPENSNNIVMELYEPVNYLDAISMEVIVPATVIPVTVLIFLGFGMNILVSRAQKDINYRTDLLGEFRQRLQELLSDEAVHTLRAATGKGILTSKRVEATILFSDIRGFTDFCENEAPERVVEFLNQSLGVVIDAVRQQGGDVDKLIGDAVLAHFQGENAADRALKAAQEALRQIKSAQLAKQTGIGIYSGGVVIGTIGAANRKDFTVIGDSVNVASRLCSAAKGGEIVIDEKSLASCDFKGTSHLETINVKGRKDPLNIARL
ncbi:MAG: adenylate/guanylate cyclase domain-containing protein [Terasakiella sp.]|uniref:adenylate/guanylate cyclase domain-containing protein n=1 Tax=unclassified Terasakiella TaxID=2614952 RepID=UPI003B00E202